jgi:hypothetical protein
MIENLVPPLPPTRLPTDPVAASVARQRGYTKTDCCPTGHVVGGEDLNTTDAGTPCDTCLGTGTLWFKPGEPPLNDQQLRAKYSRTG